MASITFAAGTVIPSTWLNDVNAIIYGSASPPANPIRVNSSSGEVSIVSGTNTVFSTKTTFTIGANITNIYNSDDKGAQFVVYSPSYASGTHFNIGASGTALISTTNAPFAIGTPETTTQPLIFGTSGTIRVHINAAGVIGVGNTPYAGWRANVRAIQLGVFPVLWEQSNGSANYGFGLYESGTNTFSYTTTGDAPTLYSQISGRHLWYNSVSGTAGGAVTLSKVLEVDTSGNLIAKVNTSAPTLVENSNMTFSLTSNTNLRISVRGTDGVTRVANITLA